MKRLKDLLQKKIDRVRIAEMRKEWNINLIKSETEFLLEIKKLILDFESLKLETLIVEPSHQGPETKMRDDLIRGLLIELLGMKVAGLPLFMLDFNIQRLIEYRKLNIKGSKVLCDMAIRDYCDFHLKTAPAPEKEYLNNILNHLNNEETKIN